MHKKQTRFSTGGRMLETSTLTRTTARQDTHAAPSGNTKIHGPREASDTRTTTRYCRTDRNTASFQRKRYDFNATPCTGATTLVCAGTCCTTWRYGHTVMARCQGAHTRRQRRQLRTTDTVKDATSYVWRRASKDSGSGKLRSTGSDRGAQESGHRGRGCERAGGEIGCELAVGWGVRWRAMEVRSTNRR